METIDKREARTPAPQVLAIWQEYQRTGDRELRDRLIFMFMPMVRYIVYRKVREVPAQCDVEDFLSCGLEALIRSIDRYDPDKGATLEQYAWTRIHGRRARRAAPPRLGSPLAAPRRAHDQQRPRKLPRRARTPARPRRSSPQRVGMTAGPS